MTMNSMPPNCVSNLLNTAEFQAIYGQRPGMLRRRELRKFFMSHPDGILPVNNKWQANSILDPDLKVLLKKGILSQGRDGHRVSPSRKKTSHKRQSYLYLSPEYK